MFFFQAQQQMNAQNSAGQPGQQYAYYNNGMAQNAQPTQLVQQQFGQQHVVMQQQMQQQQYPQQQFASSEQYVSQGKVINTICR